MRCSDLGVPRCGLLLAVLFVTAGATSNPLTNATTTALTLSTTMTSAPTTASAVSTTASGTAPTSSLPSTTSASTTPSPLPSNTSNNNSTTTSAPTPNATTAPNAGASGEGGSEPSTVIFALLGIVVGLVAGFLLLALVKHYHTRRGCCGCCGAPSAAAADDDEEAAWRHAQAKKLKAKMKFGKETLVRGEHLARLVQYHEQQRKNGTPPAETAAGAGAPNLSEHSMKAMGTLRHFRGGGDSDDAPSPVNPIDRIAGDGVTSHAVPRGAIPDAIWADRVLVAADGAHVALEGLETPLARSFEPPSEFGAPPNTTVAPPKGRAAEAMEPFIVTLTPVEAELTPSATPGKDPSLLQKMRNVFTGSRGVASDDPRLPQYTHAQVYDTLRSRSRASSRVGGARASRGALHDQVQRHEDAEAMMVDMVGDSSALVSAWLEHVEEPPVPESTKQRAAREWARELPPAPAGDRGEQRFADDRTAAWVHHTNSGPYDIPAAPGVGFHGNPNERWLGPTTTVVRYTAPPPAPAAHSNAALTAKALKLPPKRDALGRSLD